MIANPKQDCIYHYTSNSALLSILESKSLWMSSRHHLNDTKEGEQFFNILNRKATKKRIAEIKSTLDAYEFFVTCFSSDDDSLSQWRGYAENGTGVAIAFHKNAIMTMIRKNHETLLYPVAYAEKFKDLPAERQHSIQEMLDSVGVPSKQFIDTMTKERWAVKPKGFHEEKEWRLIVTLDSRSGSLAPKATWLKISYSATPSFIREHCEFSFEPRDVVKSIILGPNNKTDEPTLKRYLHGIGLENVEISKSSISYR